jgi:hypothetical protein
VKRGFYGEPFSSKKSNIKESNIMIIRGANAFFVAGALCLTACGSDDSDDVADAGRNLARAPELQGAWVSDCDAYGPLKLSGKAFSAFEPLRYKKKIAIYSDNACATQTAEVRYTGEYKIGNSDDLPRGLNRVDFTPKTLVVKPTSDEGAKALNALKLCGISDWKVDASRDVSQAAKKAGCLAEKLEVAQFDVYSLDDNKLKFGSTYLLGAPTKAENRPSQLNERVFQTTDKWE